MVEAAVGIVRPLHHGMRRMDDRRHVRDVGDVAVVDLVHVADADAVAGNVDLARRKREPAHRRRAADADRHADVRPADPADERRCIHRPRHPAPRRPAPAVAHVDPAAVVERREAPRRVVDPGPAPGVHEDPVAVAVRRPAGDDDARHPQRAVLVVLLPAAVAVEIVDARHLGRDVARRRAARIGAVAVLHPGGEGVAHRLRQRVLRAAVAPHFGALAARHGDGAALALQQALAAQHGDLRALVEAVVAVEAGAVGAEARLGRQQLELARRLAAAQPHCDAAVVQLDLHGLVVQARDLDLGAAVEQQRGRADVDLGLGRAFSGDAVARRHRPVARRGDPFADIAAVDPHLTLRLPDAADAAGRVDFSRLRLQRRCSGVQQRRRPCSHPGLHHSRLSFIPRSTRQRPAPLTRAPGQVL